MRELGFYWVKSKRLDWEIAKWEKSWRGYEQWAVCGGELYLDDEDFDEIDERKIERTEQYGPIIVLRMAFDAGMQAVTYNGRPGYPDAPKFDEWLQRLKKDPPPFLSNNPYLCE